MTQARHMTGARQLALAPYLLLFLLPFRSAAEKSAVDPVSPVQELHLDTGAPRPATRQQVELLEDTLTIEAGKPQEVELRFRVGAHLHINSHTPKDELLLPTVLKLEPTPGLQLENVFYPAGHPFHLAIGAGETLDVYQDEFRLHLRLTATPGPHTVNGTLRYQACDAASCFPPHTLPIHLTLTAK